MGEYQPVDSQQVGECIPCFTGSYAAGAHAPPPLNCLFRWNRVLQAAVVSRTFHNVASCTYLQTCHGEGNSVTGTGNVECTDCDKGHFANVSGMSQCEPCAPGSYMDAAGMSNCDLCGIG